MRINTVEVIKMTIEENVFNQVTEEELSLVSTYYDCNEKKKELEKWLKSNKSRIETVLEKYGRSKMDFGQLRVNYVVPDSSKFDNEKLVEFCLQKGLESCLKYTVNEEALTDAIEREVIDVDELKQYAWVEGKGSPRITVSKVNKE